MWGSGGGAGTTGRQVSALSETDACLKRGMTATAGKYERTTAGNPKLVLSFREFKLQSPFLCIIAVLSGMAPGDSGLWVSSAWPLAALLFQCRIDRVPSISSDDGLLDFRRRSRFNRHRRRIAGNLFCLANRSHRDKDQHVE